MSTSGIDEQYTHQDSGNRHDNGSRSKGAWWAFIVGAFIVGIIGGLVAGIQIGKGSSAVATNDGTGNQQMGGGFGGFNGMRGGTIGTVTAVTSDSISVEDSRQSTTVTYTITSSTTITDNGVTASVSDITVGDSVLVQADSSSSSSETSTAKTAKSIELNPTIPSGIPGTTSSSSSSN